jgi:hypothetical protein
MNRSFGIALQLLGCGCLVATITTICNGTGVVFDPSFPVRAVAGVTGIVFVLVGGYVANLSKNARTNH